MATFDEAAEARFQSTEPSDEDKDAEKARRAEVGRVMAETWSRKLTADDKTPDGESS